MPAISGRPDGRLSKYIYADGQGGVCRDMRYSANGLTPTDFAEADQRVKNGTYRGFEKAVFTKAVHGTSGGDTDIFGLYYHETLPSEGNFIISQRNGVSPMVVVGDVQHIYEKSTGLVLSGIVTSVSAASIRCRRLGPDVGIRSYSQASSANFIWVGSVSQTPSIGGSFLQTTQYGNPSALLQAFPNGWQGDWSPTVPSGAISAFPLTRKALAAPTAMRSTNNGTSWTAFTPTFDAVKNEVALTNEPATNIVILQYQAFAKQTKPSANAVVYGGQSGVGEVTATSYYNIDRGGLLAESTLGLILKDSSLNNINGGGKVTRVNISGLSGKLDAASWGYPDHTSIDLLAPTNTGSAFKALNYNTNINQQAFVQYAYTELKHNGTNWGDDGKVTIVDNQSTKTDLNGNTVLVGTAQTCESLGWIKNKV